MKDCKYVERLPCQQENMEVNYEICKICMMAQILETLGYIGSDIQDIANELSVMNTQIIE